MLELQLPESAAAKENSNNNSAQALVEHFRRLDSSHSLNNPDIATTTSPILLMGKLKHREVNLPQVMESIW